MKGGLSKTTGRANVAGGGSVRDVTITFVRNDDNARLCRGIYEIV